MKQQVDCKFLLKTPAGLFIAKLLPFLALHLENVGDDGRTSEKMSGALFSSRFFTFSYCSLLGRIFSTRDNPLLRSGARMSDRETGSPVPQGKTSTAFSISPPGMGLCPAGRNVLCRRIRIKTRGCGRSFLSPGLTSSDSILLLPQPSPLPLTGSRLRACHWGKKWSVTLTHGGFSHKRRGSERAVSA